MSKIANIVTRKHNHVIKKYYGDTAIFRAKGQSGFAVTVVKDIRDIVSFSGSAYSSVEAPNSMVDQQEIWFLMFLDELAGRSAPKSGDEIVFEGKAHEIVQAQDEAYGKLWLRVHLAEVDTGEYRGF
jgi:hypothetical protein